jgi:hypothetical protein
MNTAPEHHPSKAAGRGPLDRTRDRLSPQLADLVSQTRELLACPDPNVEAWQEYSRRREAIFARLGEMDFEGSEGEEAEEVQDLLQEILQQDATVIEKLKTRLSSLQEDLTALAKARRGLRGYTSPQPPPPPPPGA